MLFHSQRGLRVPLHKNQHRSAVIKNERNGKATRVLTRCFRDTIETHLLVFWQKVLDTWKEWVELISVQQHHRRLPGRLCLCRVLLQSAIPTVILHNCKWNNNNCIKLTVTIRGYHIDNGFVTLELKQYSLLRTCVAHHTILQNHNKYK